MNKDINVKYSYEDRKFVFYNGDQLLGNMSIDQIIKYSVSKIDNSFLKLVDHEPSVHVIEKFLYKLNDNNEIILTSYLDSPVTGNLEMMMKIYNEINNFENKILQNEIKKIESKEIRENISEQINELIYLILNHIMMLIVNISDAIKGDETKTELKSTLMKYSIFINNKINYIIKDTISHYIDDYKLLEVELDQMRKIKSSTNEKIKNIEKEIKNQNNQINKIVEYINIDDIDNLINPQSGGSEQSSPKDSNYNESDYAYNEDYNEPDEKVQYLSENE